MATSAPGVTENLICVIHNRSEEAGVLDLEVKNDGKKKRQSWTATASALQIMGNGSYDVEVVGWGETEAEARANCMYAFDEMMAKIKAK